MEEALTIAEAVLLIAPHVAELIESLTGPAYDQENEKQAMLNLSRAIADARVAQALKK